jgi:hypothetical protein
MRLTEIRSRFPDGCRVRMCSTTWVGRVGVVKGLETVAANGQAKVPSLVVDLEASRLAGPITIRCHPDSCVLIPGGH